MWTESRHMVVVTQMWAESRVWLLWQMWTESRGTVVVTEMWTEYRCTIVVTQMWTEYRCTIVVTQMWTESRGMVIVTEMWTESRGTFFVTEMWAGSAGGIPGWLSGSPAAFQCSAGHVSAAWGGRLLCWYLPPHTPGPPPGRAACQREGGQDAGVRCHPGLSGTSGQWACYMNLRPKGVSTSSQWDCCNFQPKGVSTSGQLACYNVRF